MLVQSDEDRVKLLQSNLPEIIFCANFCANGLIIFLYIVEN